MAELKGNILGNLSGSISNITVRTRYGKSYVSAKPSSFKIPNDTGSVQRRGKFKIAVKFTSSILKNPILKKIWRPYAKNPKLVFQHLVPINYKLMRNSDLSAFNIITPANGFHAEIKNFNQNEEEGKFELVVTAQENEINISDDLKIRAAAVFYLSNSVNDNDKLVQFIFSESEMVELGNNDIPFSFKLSKNDIGKLNAYNSISIYAAVYLVNEEEVEKFSVTVFSKYK